MKSMRHVALAVVLAALSIFAFAPSIFAQTAPAAGVQAIGPLTRDLGSLKTFTLQNAGTLISADQTGYNVSRVICVLNVSASAGGSPSTTFSIHNKDAASGGYYTLLTSSAVTATATPTAIAAGAGVVTTANVGAGLPIARTWRVVMTVAGTTPTITGTLGCSVQ